MNITNEALGTKGLRSEAKDLLQVALSVPTMGLKSVSNLLDCSYLYTVEVQMEGAIMHSMKKAELEAKASVVQELLPEIKEIALMEQKAELAEKLAAAKKRLAAATAGTATATSTATATASTAGTTINPLADASAI